ncbi:MAG: hypothetical protein K8R69_05185 [Deltaproteobacteria bacterium]|nr:hypothetical protein [Deltaproteobacteria bacterium]
MAVGGATGPGGQPVDTGSPPPGGPDAPPGGASGAPPAGPGGAGDGAAPPGGNDFGTFDGMVDTGEFLDMASAEANLTNDVGAQNLLNQIRLNTVSQEGSAGATVSQGMAEGASEHASAMADTHTDRFTDARELEARGEVRGSIRDALASGDQKELMSLFSRFSSSPRGSGSGNPAKGAPNPNAPNPANPGAAGPMAPPPGGPTGGRAEGGPPANPPLVPNASGSLGQLTQPRLANLSGRISSMPEGTPKTQAQQLETRLRAALAASPPDHEAAQAALDGLAAMGIEMGETDEPDALESREGTDAATDGDGEEGRTRDGMSREGGGAPRRVARTFTSDDLSRSVTVFASGERGGNADGEDHLTRMGTGLRVICGGRGTDFATRVATDGAVRGTYAEDDSGGDGTGGGGSSGDGSVAFGGLVDGDGSLAAGGYRLDTAAAGLGGSYGVRTSDGRFIPQWLALSEHGGLPPGVRAAVARDAGLRTRFGAESVSGARAGVTGDLYAGARC